MPYPRNIKVARTVEMIIRLNGAVPATCAIINGNLSVNCDLHNYGVLASMAICTNNDEMNNGQYDKDSDLFKITTIEFELFFIS